MFNIPFRLHLRPRLIAELFGLLALAPLLAVGLAGLSGVGHRWVDLLAQFTAPVLALSVVLSLVMAAFRLRAAWAGLIAVTTLALAVAPQALPPQAPEPGAAATIRLYSANLYALNDDVAAIGESIRAADADVLVLVEFGAAPAANMETLLAGYAHRHVSDPVTRREDTVRTVIASRYPLSPLSTRGAERQVLSAVADTPIGPVRVVAAHLTRPWPYQFQWGQIIQAQFLIDHIQGAAEPVVLAGDFNSVATGRIGRMLRSEGGLIAAPGWPGTWPAALPGPLRITIDQVYRSPDLAVASRRLGRPTGSDHRPVIVDLAPAHDAQASVHQASPRPPLSPSPRATQSQTS